MDKFIFFLIFFTSLFAAAADELLSFEKNINQNIENQIQLSIEKGELELQINDLQQKIRSKKSFIVKRLKALYSLKNYRWGQLLVESDPYSIEKTMKILKRLNNNDFANFQEYNQSLRQLALSRKNLQETEDLLKQSAADLLKQQEHLANLESQKIKKLSSSNTDSLLLLKGNLARPLDGTLVTGFGAVKDKDDKYYLISKGEVYKNLPNTLVKSVGPGTIIFDDVLAGRGQTLIVEHSDNYYSVYAGLRHVQKNVGDRLAKNEWLGSTDRTDFYFELRHFDRPINPKSWYGE